MSGMRNTAGAACLVSLLVFAGAAAFAPAAGAGEGDDALVKSLEAADPLAEGSSTPGIAPADAGLDASLRAIAASDKITPLVRSRARRLLLALELADRVRAGRAKPDLGVWLALDEIALKLPRKGPGEALLRRALPDDVEREALTAAIAAARETARRFCLDWNEIETPGGEDAKRNAALRAELEKAGAAAVPYVLDVLAVPPQASFGVMDPAKGTTARQQVRAVFALGFVDAKAAVPFLVLHVKGPSFTLCTNAQAQVRRFAGIRAGPGAGDEEAAVKEIETWWPAHRADYSLALDRLVRSVLCWTRDAVRSTNRDTVYWAQFGPAALERVLGCKIEFVPDDAAAANVARIDATEAKWLAGELK
jgi:hypothetical protein